MFQIDSQFYTSEMISLLLQNSEDNEEHQRLIQLNHSLMEPYLVELKFSSFQPLSLDLSKSDISTMSVFDFADEVFLLKPLMYNIRPAFGWYACNQTYANTS